MCGKITERRSDGKRRCQSCANTAHRLWRNKNKEHANGYLRRYNQSLKEKDPVAFKAKRRAHNAKPEIRLKRQDRYRRYTFGINTVQWEQMFEAQGRRCAICRTAEPMRRLSWAIDHDHATNKIRGILCHNCNKGLGLFMDNPEFMRLAAIYIEVSRLDGHTVVEATVNPRQRDRRRR